MTHGANAKPRRRRQLESYMVRNRVGTACLCYFDGTITYTINDAGRNVGAKDGGTTLASYTHNALGQRVVKNIPGAGGEIVIFHDADRHLGCAYDLNRKCERKMP